MEIRHARRTMRAILQLMLVWGLALLPMTPGLVTVVSAAGDDRDRDRENEVPMDKPTGAVPEKAKPDGLVKLEDVVQYANQKYEVTVKFEVKSSAYLGGKSGLTFLNSETNFKDAKNFVVLIPPGVLSKFKSVGIEEPHKHYKGKTVVVTGKVSTYKSKPQIVVYSPDGIKIDGAPTGDNTGGFDRDRDR